MLLSSRVSGCRVRDRDRVRVGDRACFAKLKLRKQLKFCLGGGDSDCCRDLTVYSDSPHSLYVLPVDVPGKQHACQGPQYFDALSA